MISRRKVTSGLISLGLAGGLPPPSWAQDEDANELVAEVPEELGLADFSQVWTLAPDSTAVLVAAPPDLPPNSAEKLSKLFYSAADADKSFGDAGFIAWFNAKVAGKKSWTNKRIDGKQADYVRFWDQFLSVQPITAMGFVGYMSIFVNEVAGELISREEIYGMKAHPGIAYLFNRVTLTSADGKRKWTKQSYNTGKANRSAGELFNDPLFVETHGNKVLGSLLRYSKDPIWLGNLYPASRYPTSGDPNKSGFILEADFFKFRGRGLIQTTWRSNYLKIVEYIKAYQGDDPLLKKYRVAWEPRTADEVCTITTNADWAELFADNSKLVLCEAIRLHAKPSNYASLSSNDAVLNGASRGSLRYMGESIGGSDNYGKLFKARVRDIVLGMWSDKLI